MTAESLYERRWVMTLLESVMHHLRQEHEVVGRLAEYEQLKPCLTAERGAIDYDSIAAALNIQPAFARSKVHRLRSRFRKVFREEVLGTVSAADSQRDSQCWSRLGCVDIALCESGEGV
jgi:hypothetical protein